jgi:hypothetical protein
MALEVGVRQAPAIAEVPQIAEFAPGKTFTPQIAAVFTGIAGRIAAMFRLGRTIEFLSDESMLFMSLA